MLALATDAASRFLAHHRHSADTEQITLLAGQYHIPSAARPLLWAAIETHDNPGPGQLLFG